MSDIKDETACAVCGQLTDPVYGHGGDCKPPAALEEAVAWRMYYEGDDKPPTRWAAMSGERGHCYSLGWTHDDAKAEGYRIEYAALACPPSQAVAVGRDTTDIDWVIRHLDAPSKAARGSDRGIAAIKRVAIKVREQIAATQPPAAVLNMSADWLAQNAPMYGEEEARLRKIVSEKFGPGWLTHDCEAAANAIASLRTALASQIEITNTERSLAERLAKAPTAAVQVDDAMVQPPLSMTCLLSGSSAVVTDEMLAAIRAKDCDGMPLSYREIYLIMDGAKPTQPLAQGADDALRQAAETVIQNFNNATAIMRSKNTNYGPNRIWLTEQVNVLRAALAHKGNR